MKHGRSDIVKQMGISVPEEEVKKEHDPKDLSKDIQSLGPTFIKLGQFLSTQGDFLSTTYQDALADLQDKVDTFPYEEVEKTVFEELGVKIKDAFNDFNPVPLAAGSLSQVHLAELRSGRIVAVKIQRPKIKEQIIEDLEMLKELGQFLDEKEIFGKHYYWEDRVNAFKAILLDELDFRKEAQNLKIFSRNLKEFDLIIPSPVMDYTNERILTMEYISSSNISTLHPLLKLELEGEELIKELLRAYLKQIFIDGFVHIDPHPGNIYLSDTNQIVLLDLGMMEHIPPQFQQDLLKILIAISSGKGEEVADLVIKLGQYKDDFEYTKFREAVADMVAKHLNLKMEEIPLGRLFLNISKIAVQHHLRLPQKFNTFGKMMLNLDKICKILAPNLNPSDFIQENIESLLTKKLKNIFTKSTFSIFSLEVIDFLQRFPSKLNSFLDAVSKTEHRIKIQTFDEHKIMTGFEKVSNRIASGLIIASMIISGAMLMKYPTSFQIFEYPGLAILLFLGAILGGLIFLLNILLYDEKKDDKHKK